MKDARRPVLAFGSLGLWAFLIAAPSVSAVEASSVRLVSRAEPSVPSQAAGGVAPSVSADGRFAAFVSWGTIVSGQVDNNDYNDVFLVDRQTGEVRLVSHATGSPLRTGNASSWNPVASADGRFIAFMSDASDLVPGHFSGGPAIHQIYLYSTLDDSITLVSHRPGAPTTGGDGASSAPVVSADGGYVAFQSAATDLVTDSGGPSHPEVYLFERASGTVRLVSHALGSPTSPGNGAQGSSRPSISADGSRIAFVSQATNLVAGTDSNQNDDVFVYARDSDCNTLVSHTAGAPGVAADHWSSLPVISADGRVVVFSSPAADLLPGFDGAGRRNVFRYSVDDGAISILSHASGAPTTGGNGESGANPAAVSANGDSIVFDSTATDLVPGFTGGPSTENLFLHSSVNGTLTLVSHRLGSAVTAGNGGSFFPHVTADGSVVAFASGASDLVAGVDQDHYHDIFVFEPGTGEVVLVSHLAGQPGIAASAEPWWGFDVGGPLVAFCTPAGGLSPKVDANGIVDVYLFDRNTRSNTLATLFPDTPPSATANGRSELYAIGPRLSADGRYLTFNSTAADLVPGQVDPSGPSDVFWHDRVGKETRLVSHLPGLPTTSSNQMVAGIAVSADGRYVLFSTNYPIPPGCYRSSIHVWSSVDDSLETILAPDPDCVGITEWSPVMSADGAYVAFVASNDVTPSQVYLWSRQDRSVRLLSHAAGQPGVPGNSSSGSYGVSISADGLWLAFTSYSTDLVGGPPSGGGFPDLQVFLYSRMSDATRLVSHAAGAPTVPGNASSVSPMISADGEVVAFLSSATDLTGATGVQVYLFRRTTGQVTLASHAAGSPLQGGNGPSGFAGFPPVQIQPTPLVVSADGAHVAFNSLATDLVAGSDDNGRSDVFLYSATDGSVRLVSHVPGQPATAAAGYSWLPSVDVIRTDGEAVVFNSDAPDLIAGAAPSSGIQVFLYTSQNAEIGLASPSLSGPTAPPNRPSFPGFLSADGSWVAFSSPATDLVPGDLNSQSDVFLFGPARPGADLAVGAASATTVTPPGAFEATYVVVNLGPEPARGVTLSLTRPPGLSRVAASGACISWPCALGTLLPGQLRTVTVRFEMPSGYVAPDPAVVRVTATTVTPDSNALNDAAEAVVAVLPRADLELSLSGPASATPPDQLTYALAVTNRGPSDAASVQVDYPTPPGLVPLSSSGDCPTLFPCFLGNLRPGASRTASVTFALPETYAGPDPIRNEAVTSSTTADPQTANNRGVADTALDSATAALGYFTLPPCRLVDTREPTGAMGGPALVGGIERWFTVTGQCGIPAGAQAVVLNATVTGPDAAGNLLLWPAGRPAPPSSVVSFASSQTRGTSVIVRLNTFGALAALVSPSVGTAHAILDVSGYFE